MRGDLDDDGDIAGDGDGDARSFPFLLPEGDFEGGEADGEFEGEY